MALAVESSCSWSAMLSAIPCARIEAWAQVAGLAAGAAACRVSSDCKGAALARPRAKSVVKSDVDGIFKMWE